MAAIANLFRSNNFARILVDSLPCGFLVVDRDGRVQIVNDIFERVLGVNKNAAVGKGTGSALRCLHVTDHPKGCGFGECCNDCEVQKLTFDALSTNQAQKARAQLKIMIDGQVRDLALLINASPFMLDNEIFCILIIEDFDSLRAFTPADSGNGFRGIVGRSKSMRELFDTIRQVARTDAPILVQGESGTGKELVALALHKESFRAPNHFVPVNCGALPEGLLETELFGHVKGAFTGAHRDRKGRFELADGGTIFLDEVAELKPDIQAKLLRVLEDGSFEPVGSEKTARVDARVISATNKKLEQEVYAGRFRQDLYYRLCVMPILIPPLRDRREDIPLLIDHFNDQFSEKAWGKKLAYSEASLSILMTHAWPGNVRELINTIKFAMVKCKGQQVRPEHLPVTLQSNIAGLYSLKNRKSKLHRADVVKALKKTGGNKCRAAEILGVSRSTLYRFFEKQSSA